MSQLRVQGSPPVWYAARARHHRILMSWLLVLFWAQPIVQYRYGVPVASFALAAVLAVLTILAPHRILRTRLRGVNAITFALATWAIFLVLLGRSWTILEDVLTLALVVVGAQILATSPSDALIAIRRAARVILSGSALAAFIQVKVSPSLFGVIAASDTAADRVLGLHYNPNGGALFVLMALTVEVARVFTTGRVVSRRAVSLGFVIIGVWSLALMSSRGAIIALGLALLCGIAFALSSRRNTDSWVLVFPIALVALGLVAGGALLGSTVAQVAERATHLLGRDVAGGDVSNVRFYLWSVAAHHIEQHPIAGSDLEYASVKQNNAHNAILDFAVRYGLPGALLLLLLLICVMLAAFRMPRKGPNGAARLTSLMLTVATLGYAMTHLGLVNNSILWMSLVWLTHKGPPDPFDRRIQTGDSGHGGSKAALYR